MVYTYKYPRPALSIDCVVFGLDDKDILKILLIRRNREPFENMWALPGGFVKPEKDQSIDHAARRELEEETGVCNLPLEQLHTFGNQDRDPREWVASVAYYALVNLSEHSIQADTDASDAQWFPITALPDPLAFDHQEIIDTAVARLKSKIRHEPIGFDLLPQKFTLAQLQNLYETILGQELDKRNFLRKFHKMGLLIDLNQFQEGVSHRPAKLYQFDKAKYRQLQEEEGFNFEVKQMRRLAKSL